MKLSKILAIGLAVLTMTACSDDDEFNFNSDGNVTVDMAQPSITLKENKGYFNVPVVVRVKPTDMYRLLSRFRRLQAIPPWTMFTIS